jgi:uncharacterized protein (TIGR02996 family)
MTEVSQTGQLAVLPDPSGLLRAIMEFPEEDTPRLEYADWLEEQPTDRVACRRCGGNRKLWRPIDVTKHEVPQAIGPEGQPMVRAKCRGCSGVGTVVNTANKNRAGLISVQCELAKYEFPACEQPIRTQANFWGVPPQEKRCHRCGACRYAEANAKATKHLTDRESQLLEPVCGPLCCITRKKGEGFILDPTFVSLDLHFQRGFLAEVRCPWERWAKGGDELRAKEWVPSVTLSARPTLTGLPAGRITLTGDPKAVSWPDWEIAALAEADIRDWEKIACELRWPGTAFHLPTVS